MKESGAGAPVPAPLWMKVARVLVPSARCSESLGRNLAARLRL
jgi:hypothetical protein